MKDIERQYKKVQFINVTDDICSRMGRTKYPYEFFQCMFEHTNIGTIAWHEGNKQYCYLPATNISLPSSVLVDIYEQIFILMSERKLN